MKLYLAAVANFAETHDLGVADWKNVCILESFFYAKKSAYFERFYNKGIDLLLDSGAFTFMASGKRVDWDKYVEEYAAFINKYQIEKFFELDIDSIVGLQEVERLRTKLETLTGRKCIPVWHKSRGIDYWHKMCSEYDYVAFGGLMTDGVSKKTIKRVLPTFVRIAQKYGVKMHCLGYTPSDILAERLDFYSVDSTSWLCGNRMGIVMKFLGDKMLRLTIPRDKRVKPKETVAHNFLEWFKYAEWLKTYNK